MDQIDYQRCSQYDPFQVQDGRADNSQATRFRGRPLAIAVAVIFLIAVLCSSSRVQRTTHLELLQEVHLQSVLHRGENCWFPCGKIGGDCPGFCGSGMACCRHGAAFDPPECHGVTDFRTNHHECVAPVWNITLKHQGQYCLKHDRCGTSGDCPSFCGEGNACCKSGSPYDPPECANIKEFPTRQFHTCVAPVEHVPVKHQLKNCLSSCDGRPGRCDWCGSGNLCCHFGDQSDPLECRSVMYFPTKRFHTCVNPGAQLPQSSTTAQMPLTSTAEVFSTVQASAATLSSTRPSTSPMLPTTQQGSTSAAPSTAWTSTDQALSTSPESPTVPTVSTLPVEAQPVPILPTPSTPKTLMFYVYRAQGDHNFALENVNAGNVGGVLRYLHDEVVITCPRLFKINRIIRYKVAMRVTHALFDKYRWQFGPFVAFNDGKCTVPDCPEIWEKYGYVVGCQKQGTTVAHYPDGVWYSFPGPCPSQNFSHKSSHCRQQEPGGHCATPDGTRECSVHAEYAGQISLDDIAGIRNYNTRCSQGLLEYDSQADRGNGTSFWNGKRDLASCAKRENLLLEHFKTKYPHMPSSLPEPECDWWR